MFKKTDDHATEKQTKAEEPARLMEDELDAVVGAGIRTPRRGDAFTGVYNEISFDICDP